MLFVEGGAHVALSPLFIVLTHAGYAMYAVAARRRPCYLLVSFVGSGFLKLKC